MPVAASAEPPADVRDEPTASRHGLVLVSTPIGNLGDLTARARQMLESADLVLCEDTRRTSRLLSALESRARTEALHDHNEDARTPGGPGAAAGMARRSSGVGRRDTSGIGSSCYRLVRAAVAAVSGR